jgi:NDP-sugar pyrophosphorylase family protein
MGTAGAIKYAEEFIKETVVILNGDNLINLDIAETVRFHREKRAVATIVLETLANPTGYGLVEIDEERRIRNFLEKPGAGELAELTTRTVNAGTYVLEPEVLNLIPAGENHSFEYGVFPELLRRDARFFAYVTDSYWLDAGTPSRYLQAHQDLINGKVEGFEITDDRGRSEIALTAEVSDNSFIGSGCTIENLANIENSVLGDDVSVGEKAVVENSVIGARTRIGAGAHLSGAIIGRDCRIGSHAAIIGERILGDGSVLTDYSKV